jgi:hypothetical protein
MLFYVSVGSGLVFCVFLIVVLVYVDHLDAKLADAIKKSASDGLALVSGE